MIPEAELIQLLTPLADRIERIAHALLAGPAPESGPELALPGPLVSYSTQEEWAHAVRLWLPHADAHVAAAPVRDCPACGSAAHRFLFHSFDRFPYHECLSCGTWFITTLISRELINGFLDQEPRARALLASSLIHRTDEGRMEADKPRFREYFANLAPFMRGRTAPLYVDVGCGAGCSLMVAQEHGFRVLGIEEDESLVAWGHQRSLPMQSDPLPPADVSLVSFWESLEHFPRPLEALQAIAGRMGPQCLLAMTVPNGSSLALKLLRQDASWVNGGWGTVFGHMNLFSHNGLHALLERAGFEVLLLDSQYGSNLPEIAAHVLGHHRGAADLFGVPAEHLARPAASRSSQLIFNALGPALSELERSLNLAPILIAVACAKGTRGHWQAAVADYWRLRDLGITQRGAAASADPELAEQARSRDELTRSQTAIQDQVAKLAALQAEIDQRDLMLVQSQARLEAETAKLEALQVEVDRRDALLADSQRQLAAQAEVTLRVQAEVSRRDGLLAQGQKHSATQAAAIGRAQREVDRRDRLLAKQAGIAADEIARRDALLAEAQARLDAQAALTAQVQAEVGRRDALLAEAQARLDAQAALTAQVQADVGRRDALLAETQARLDAQAALTVQVQAEVGRRDALLAETQARLDAQAALTVQVQAEVGRRDALLAETQARLDAQAALTVQVQAEVDRRDALLAETQAHLDAQAALTARVQAEVVRRDALLAEIRGRGDVAPPPPPISSADPRRNPA